MYEAYQYTAMSGIALRTDYVEYMAKRAKCKRDYKVHFTNTDSMEVD